MCQRTPSLAPGWAGMGLRMGVTRTNGTAPPDVPLSDIDLGTWDFWGLDDDIRDGAFATLRREAPITFHESFVAEGQEKIAGHWALTRYDDVFYASRHPEVFSSALGITIGDQTSELAEYFGSMIAMDDPRHTRLRNIVRSAFTPRDLAARDRLLTTRPKRGARRTGASNWALPSDEETRQRT